ncbi:MAG: type II toxin-antitoxin system HipA family toxin [Deltaproteobacteria bacterium]
MSTVAEVRLWGRTIGAAAIMDGSDIVLFEYDPSFIKSGIEVAPLVMPLAKQVYSFPFLAQQSFHGLPGLLADSLPDKFGNTLINTWLAAQGRSPESFNAVERLCYTGTRGMGALEFLPAIGSKAKKASHIQIGQLVDFVSEILSQRNGLQASFSETKRETALKEILRVGTSAGGARAKAIIAWNPETNEVRSGQGAADPGFEHWLLKFDGVSSNKDKELEDPKGYGAIEYAYYLMATDAGITMSKCRLLEEDGRRHFMTRRFDRLPDGDKLHMQSLGALAHFDYNMAGTYSYEQTLMTIRQLGLPMSSTEEMFRRMVFNIVARNQDDHVKNIAFLMDKSGTWSLAPAFDVAYSYQPSGLWTSSHQMSMNGKRDNFTIEDFRACAKSASMKRGRAETILNEVCKIVKNWPEYAVQSGVPNVWRDSIEKISRTNLAA